MIFLIFFTMFFLIIFIISHIHDSHKYEGRAIGTIVKIREDYYYYKFSKIYQYYITYRYTVDGVIYEEECRFSESIIVYQYTVSGFTYGKKYLLSKETDKTFPIGKEVLLQYDEKKPQKFMPTGKEEMFFKQTFELGLITAAMLVLTIVKLINL